MRNSQFAMRNRGLRGRQESDTTRREEFAITFLLEEGGSRKADGRSSATSAFLLCFR